MSMTTTQAAVDHANDPQETDYLHARSGIKHWLYTVDHKRIGVMYLVAVALAFLGVIGLAGAVLGMRLPEVSRRASRG